MWKKTYRVYLKGGGPKIEPDENPTEAQIADELSRELLCPLSWNLMLDPVFVSSGMTFDRSLIIPEIARQRRLNQTLVTPVTSVPMTDVLTPNLQMRSITAKFVEKYKDVEYRGSTWDDIRSLCKLYQDEQTPERVEERKREDKKMEEAKRIFELRKHKENEQQQRFIQEQMLELRRLYERERLARERLEIEKKERLARESRETRDSEISNAKIVSRPVDSERERLSREIEQQTERLVREAERQQRERLEIEDRNLRLERARLEVERARLAREAEIAREAEREIERERVAREAERDRVAREEERNRQRQAAQIAAQEETARLEQIVKANFYKQKDPEKRRRR